MIDPRLVADGAREHRRPQPLHRPSPRPGRARTAGAGDTLRTPRQPARARIPGGRWCNPAPLFKSALSEIGAKHKLTSPRRPQTNGKAEAFIKTSLREWAYAQLYLSNQERVQALPLWLAYYNHHRTHTELKDQTPMAALVSNVSRKYN
ncbi:MAG: integrase core domain-containing protein [Candidatus Dormibacter sp.]